jgi:hypothetical protein
LVDFSNTTPMEQILNLKHLGGIDDLRPFFGDIHAQKQGKYYHLIGDHNLNHTEFARFTKRPRFSSMGTVIYAGLNRICKLTQKMPSDFAVRLLNTNPNSGVVNLEIIQGRGAVLTPNTLVPAIWIQYNLKSPKFVKFSLLMYRLQCANGQMVLFDGFINEKLPSDDINHIPVLRLRRCPGLDERAAHESRQDGPNLDDRVSHWQARIDERHAQFWFTTGALCDVDGPNSGLSLGAIR